MPQVIGDLSPGKQVPLKSRPRSSKRFNTASDELPGGMAFNIASRKVYSSRGPVFLIVKPCFNRSVAEEAKQIVGIKQKIKIAIHFLILPPLRYLYRAVPLDGSI